MAKGTPPQSDTMQAPETDSASWVGESGSGSEPAANRVVLPPGTELLQYEIIRQIGRGGMGAVFLANDNKLGRRVAIKVLRTRRGGGRVDARFLREAQTTARVHHDNIVVIHEVNEHEGLLFMVLEYLEGQSLRAYLRGHTVTHERAIELIVPVARAITRAHQYGIVHRDLKPDNIFVCDSGTVKVLDFGVAKLLEGAGEQWPGPATAPLPVKGLTEDGARVGTLRYMAPEQWAGAEVDHRADIYAAGLILYELLAGQHPLDGLSDEEREQRSRDLDVPIPSIAEVADVPVELAELVDRCLQKRKEARFQRAVELLDALTPMKHTTGTRPVPTDGAPAEPPVRPRRRWASAAFAAAAAVLLTGAAWFGFSQRQLEPSELQLLSLETFGRLPDVVPRERGGVLSPDVIELGRVLWFDHRISKDDKVSCESCHPLSRYGADGLRRSVTAEGGLTGRNTPTIYHAALSPIFKWDGTVRDLEVQISKPILGRGAHGMLSSDAVEERLAGIAGYAELFAKAFPDDAAPIRLERVSLALGAFVRTMQMPAPFDAFLEGDLTALTRHELDGLQAFIQLGCTTCHVDPGVGGTKTQKLGLINPYPTDDLGMYQVTGQSQHRWVFKVPSLRNVAETGPWLHDGSIDDLREVVRLMGHHQLDRDLNEPQITAIVAFLETLTGATDPAVTARPELPGI